jgi:ceroid-lipofuscinosis MFS transporter 7
MTSFSSNSLDLVIVLVQVFLSELPRGIVVPTLFPYIRATNVADPELVASLAVSAFSVGRLVSTYPLGLLADITGSSRLALIVGILIVIVFSTVFAFAGLMGSTVAPFVIVISRFLVGFGSGTNGITRAYMARVSSPEERVKYIMYNTLCQYIGFSVTPILADLVVYLFKNNFKTPQVQFGVMPGLTTTGLSMLMLLLLLAMRGKDPSYLDKESLSSVEEQDKEINLSSQDVDEKAKEINLSSQDVDEKAKDINLSSQDTSKREQKLFACYILYLFLNFTLRGILGVVETYGANLYQQIKSPFEPANADIVRHSGEFFVYMGIIGVGVLLILPRIAKKCTPYWTLLFGIFCIIVGSILFLPFLYQANITFFSAAIVLIWSIGSPITQTLTISTYSQMMGSKPQGATMGWLTTAGALGRIIFPILSGVNYDMTSYIDVVFGIISAICLILFRVYYGLEN